MIRQMSYVAWLRSRIGHRKVFLAGTAVVVRDRDGKVLFRRRGDDGTWALPGGVLERGERLVDSARREVREETGHELGDLRLVGVYSEPDTDVTYPNGDQVQQFIVAFEVDAAISPVGIDSDKTIETAWFSPDRLPPMPPWHRQILADTGRSEPVWQPPQRRYDALDQISDIRSIIGSDHCIGVGAIGIVRDAAGRTLMIRRADDGSWGFPGGYLDLGENADSAVIREVREEIGVDVLPVRLLGVHAEPEPWVYPNGDQTQSVVAIFECTAAGETATEQGVEADSAAWLHLDETFVASLIGPTQTLAGAVLQWDGRGFVVP